MHLEKRIAYCRRQTCNLFCNCRQVYNYEEKTPVHGNEIKFRVNVNEEPVVFPEETL
jgi:hypothetical protein